MCDWAAPLPPLQAPSGFQSNQSGLLGSPPTPPQDKELQCGLAQGQPARRLFTVVPTALPCPLDARLWAANSGGVEEADPAVKAELPLVPYPRPAAAAAAATPPPTLLQGCGAAGASPVGPRIRWSPEGQGLGSPAAPAQRPTVSPQGWQTLPATLRGLHQPEVTVWSAPPGSGLAPGPHL